MNLRWMKLWDPNKQKIKETNMLCEHRRLENKKQEFCKVRWHGEPSAIKTTGVCLDCKCLVELKTLVDSTIVTSIENYITEGYNDRIAQASFLTEVQKNHLKGRGLDYYGQYYLDHAHELTAKPCTGKKPKNASRKSKK